MLAASILAAPLGPGGVEIPEYVNSDADPTGIKINRYLDTNHIGLGGLHFAHSARPLYYACLGLGGFVFALGLWQFIRAGTTPPLPSERRHTKTDA